MVAYSVRCLERILDYFRSISTFLYKAATKLAIEIFFSLFSPMLALNGECGQLFESSQIPNSYHVSVSTTKWFFERAALVWKSLARKHLKLSAIHKDEREIVGFVVLLEQKSYWTNALLFTEVSNTTFIAHIKVMCLFRSSALKVYKKSYNRSRTLQAGS